MSNLQVNYCHRSTATLTILEQAIIRRKLHIKAQMLLQFYALSLFSDGIAVIVADAATTHSSAATINRYEVECINV